MIERIRRDSPIYVVGTKDLDNFDVVAKFLFSGRGVSNFRGALAGGLR